MKILKLTCENFKKLRAVEIDTRESVMDGFETYGHIAGNLPGGVIQRDIQAIVLQLRTASPDMWTGSWDKVKDICLKVANIIDFEFFCEAAEIFKSKNHLTIEGINKLREIQSKMNLRKKVKLSSARVRENRVPSGN